jgi:hypothetical protein
MSFDQVRAWLCGAEVQLNLSYVHGPFKGTLDLISSTKIAAQETFTDWLLSCLVACDQSITVVLPHHP